MHVDPETTLYKALLSRRLILYLKWLKRVNIHEHPNLDPRKDQEMYLLGRTHLFVRDYFPIYPLLHAWYQKLSAARENVRAKILIWNSTPLSGQWSFRLPSVYWIKHSNRFSFWTKIVSVKRGNGETRNCFWSETAPIQISEATMAVMVVSKKSFLELVLRLVNWDISKLLLTRLIRIKTV